MRIVMIPLETFVQLMTSLIWVLFTRKPIPCCCLASSPLNQKPCSLATHFIVYFWLSDDVQFVLAQCQLSLSYVNCFSFPRWFKVRTFQVQIVRFFLGSSMCVAFRLFLRTVAIVDVFGGTENSWLPPQWPLLSKRRKTTNYSPLNFQLQAKETDEDKVCDEVSFCVSCFTYLKLINIM